MELARSVGFVLCEVTSALSKTGRGFELRSLHVVSEQGGGSGGQHSHRADRMYGKGINYTTTLTCRGEPPHASLPSHSLHRLSPRHTLMVL
jgi:hypothetical protein